MRLELIDGIRLIIIAFLAYVPTVTISGWFTSWVAKKCDDDLPERFGFLTLDPFVHFSLFGFGLLLLGELFGSYLAIFRGFPGFGRYIFLEPLPSASKAKAALEFFARSIAHFVMLVAAFLLIIFIFKASLFIPVQELSPMFEATRSVVLFFFRQNIILFTIYFLFGVADMICFSFQIPRILSSTYFIVLIVTLLVLSDPVNKMLSMMLVLLENLFVGSSSGVIL